jgi:Ca2+-binding EF-hand superfamily protein
VCGVGEFLFHYYFVPSGDKLFDMVSEVSEDNISNTVEFNEFLKMMSKKENEEIGENLLFEAFK